MKTARYQNRNLYSKKHVLVRISRYAPRFKTCYRINAVLRGIIPSEKCFRNRFDEQLFANDYLRQLNCSPKIIDEIKYLKWFFQSEIDSGKELVLLCFEDIREDGVFCHRRIFADWWRKRTGEIVEELGEL